MEMPGPIAVLRANSLLRVIRPHVEQAEIVGSVRRYETDPSRPRDVWLKDIELLVRPHLRPGDLFGTGQPDLTFTELLIPKIGRITKGGGPHAKYIRFEARFPSPPEPAPMIAPTHPAPHGPVVEDLAAVDLFICTPPADWGALMVIRTGPAAYSKMLVTLLRARGRKLEGGRILSLDTGKPCHACPTEEAFFQACGMGFVQPHRRLTAGLHQP